MSKATLHAIHAAIAAHIEDENEDGPEYLTEWLIVASAAQAEHEDRTSYYYYDSDIPYHHALGLIHRGLEIVTDH